MKARYKKLSPTVWVMAVLAGMGEPLDDRETLKAMLATAAT